MELSNSRLPRKVKERMIREFISRLKTTSMLSKETGMSTDAITKMVARHKDKFLPILDHKPIVRNSYQT
jgi:hypothetical protein